MTTPGARLREARERAGLSTYQLAEILGTSQPRISAIETGSSVPTLDWLHRAAERLGIAPSTLDPRLTNKRQP